jgi:hypothetical protein
MAMKIQVVVFQVMTPCSDVVGCHPEDGSPLICWYLIHGVMTEKTMTSIERCYKSLCHSVDIIFKLIWKQNFLALHFFLQILKFVWHRASIKM